MPNGWRSPIPAIAGGAPTVAFDIKVGDVQMAQRDLAGALESYRDSLAIRERLAQSDPGNAVGRQDLAVTYVRIGDMLAGQDDPAGALKSYRDGLAIFDRLAQLDSGNTSRQQDLSVTYESNWRRSVGAGRHYGRCAILPRQPHHQRPAGAI